MNSKELKTWLTAQGCTFEPKRGGSGHLIFDAANSFRTADARQQKRVRNWHWSMRPKTVGFEMTLAYRVKLEEDDNDTWLVTCPQLPPVATFGTTKTEALYNAVDAIETVLDWLIQDSQNIPFPTAGDGDLVRLPILSSLKVELYWALKAANISRAELARQLGWNRESVDRLFKLYHRSRLEQIEAAFAALGKHIDIDIKSAA